MFKWHFKAEEHSSVHGHLPYSSGTAALSSLNLSLGLPPLPICLFLQRGHTEPVFSIPPEPSPDWSDSVTLGLSPVQPKSISFDSQRDHLWLGSQSQHTLQGYLW